MTTPHDIHETNAAPTDPTSVTRSLLERLDRSERALRRWRLAAQVCAGAILFGAGIAAGSAQSAKDATQQKQPAAGSSQSKSPQASPDAQTPAATAAAPAQPAQQQGAHSGSRMVGIALDLNPSGRWNSTLLAVDEDGIVYALNTAGPKPVWQRFTFSP